MHVCSRGGTILAMIERQMGSRALKNCRLVVSATSDLVAFKTIRFLGSWSV